MKESGLDLLGPERESSLGTDRRRARVIALRACSIRHEIERPSPHSPKQLHVRDLWHSDALPGRLENK